MKKLLSLVAFIIISAATYAQTGPQIEFESDEIDYGTVYKGEDDGVRTIKFTNTGDEPLIINNVKSSCGCTVPSKPTEAILPGKSDTIQVKYNMRPGSIRKTITIMSNATNHENGVVAIKIKGKVIAPENVNVLEKKKSLPSQ